MPTNPLLQRERNRASFPVELLTNVLDGGEEMTARRREIEGWIINDPAWRHPPLEFLTRDEIFATQLRKAAMFTRLVSEKGLTDRMEMYWLKKICDLDYGTSLELHLHMFVPAILGQGTDEQIDRWLEPAMSFRMIGTYAQTEMGHGTFLRGIETTATYDRQTEEFVLDSPTITSIKWWPGSLGKTTNHALVMAKLVIDEQHYGTHLFLLQTRDVDSHQPVAGVTLGDIGPKFGYEAIDNGFMRMRRVRVPRENMLMRHAEVTREGRFVRRRKEGGEKLSYGTMTLIRSLIVGGVARALARAVTIAARYSAVRLQGNSAVPQEADRGAQLEVGEMPLLDYPTQQHKLLPVLAQAFGFYICGEEIREAQFGVQAEVAEGRLDRLSEHHALSSCLKACATEICSAGIEVCRKACGGHGYSLASGLPQLYMHNVPACTYEGDNTVLLLQTARYLLKIQQDVHSSPGKKELPPSVAYLAVQSLPDQSPADVTEPSWLVAVHQHRARCLLQNAVEAFRRDIDAGMTWNVAFQNKAIQMCRVVKAHSAQVVISAFLRFLPPSGPLRPVLSRLLSLLGLHTITEESGEFLQTGCFAAEYVPRCQAGLEGCLEALRPDLVALVDAFDFPDLQLNSVLGRFDGQVYENLFAWAEASPLNKHEVHSSFQTTIRPLISGEDLPPLSKL